MTTDPCPVLSGQVFLYRVHRLVDGDRKREREATCEGKVKRVRCVLELVFTKCNWCQCWFNLRFLISALIGWKVKGILQSDRRERENRGDPSQEQINFYTKKIPTTIISRVSELESETFSLFLPPLLYFHWFTHSLSLLSLSFSNTLFLHLFFLLVQFDRTWTFRKQEGRNYTNNHNLTVERIPRFHPFFLRTCTCFLSWDLSLLLSLSLFLEEKDATDA